MEPTELLNLKDSSLRFVLLPYRTGMQLSTYESVIQASHAFALTSLKRFFDKGGWSWPADLTGPCKLRLGYVLRGQPYYTAVMAKKSLEHLIVKVDGRMGVSSRRTSERLLHRLERIETEQVLVLIFAEQMDTDQLEAEYLRERLDGTVRHIAMQVPFEGFVPYRQDYLRRGCFVQLADRRRMVAFRGFNLADEPLQTGGAVALFDPFHYDTARPGEGICWMVAETGTCNGQPAEIHPKAVCSPQLTDALLLDYLLMETVEQHRTDDEEFGFDRAAIQAVQYYAGIQDRYGEPYLLHVCRVLEKMQTEEERICALLHDVLNVRKDLSVKELYNDRIPVNIVRVINSLTQVSGEDFYDYILRVRKSPLATKVKKACLLHDMDMGRIGRVPSDEDLQRKYRMQKAYNLLTGH